MHCAKKACSKERILSDVKSDWSVRQSQRTKIKDVLMTGQTTTLGLISRNEKENDHTHPCQLNNTVQALH